MHSRHVSPHKISIWILRGGNAGVTLNFCLRKLAIRSGLAVVLLLGALIGFRLLGPSEEELNARSLALLEDYMRQQIQQAAKPAPAEANTTADQALETESEGQIDEALDRKVKLLVDEFIRVRNYENQLKARAHVLNSVLESALEIDAPELPQQDAFEPKLDDEENGMGGGDFSDSPLFSSYPSLTAKKTEKKEGLQTVVDALELQIDELSRIPLGTPVFGRPTSGFGTRISPFNGRSQKHHGYDISVGKSTVVQATADGVVVQAGNKGAYGRAIIIDHGNGFETLYGHLSKIDIKVGDSVCRGQAIGLVGSTGRSTGPHVHYEVRKAGNPQDPEPYIHLAAILKSVE